MLISHTTHLQHASAVESKDKKPRFAGKMPMDGHEIKALSKLLLKESMASS